ncbi:Nascent polypeptide-associated complex subunit alpha-like protein 1 [Hibiscus syriacus]|uniref:Nascent polypeptide-associated complex subunit alpha-like protein 1 n=1 Tax=Hibiscus syriacus TaxID=106335 RepID=A0A6A2X7G9_HIBSY|nr:Nascent polypeptide-associated complex subunit alpha-like protein 1 [Hibiscus syriacus]
MYILSGHLDGEGTGRSKQSRSQKKSSKAMLKLGTKPIPAGRLQEPHVRYLCCLWRSSQLPTQAAEQFKAPALSHVVSKPESSSALAQDDEEVDETGVEPKDIELVMTQAGV